MVFNEKDELKGDFQIVARGTAILMAREVQGEQLNKLMELSTVEQFMPYINFGKLIEAAIKNLNLENLGIMKTPEQIQIEEDRRQKAEAEDEDFAKELAWMKASSGGHMGPEAGSPQDQRMEAEIPPTNELDMGKPPEINLEP